VPLPIGPLRLAARGLSRRPGFAAVAILTIALAIGANTAIFSIVNGALLRPLPFREPERLVKLEARSNTGHMISLSIPNYRDWRDRSRGFGGVALSGGWNMRLTGRGPAEMLEGRGVVGDFFGTLGLRPEVGALFGPDAAPDHEGGRLEVVLGHAWWQQRFGGDRGLIGQTLTLAGRPYTVGGVLEPHAGFPDPNVQFYIPMATIPGLPWDDRDSGFGASAFARLGAAVTFTAARQDMTRVDREVRDVAGPTAPTAVVSTLESWYVGDVQEQLWILMGAVGFVLLIALANVGNLLLSRGEDRHRELAVRSALGAGRGALVRLLLTEALLIAGAGGLLGAALAYATVQALVPLLPAEIPSVLRAQIQVDGLALAFGVGLALLAGVLFGLFPALHASRVDLAGSFKSGARTTDPGRSALRSALVVSEVALALVLLVGAGLMLKSLDRLLNVDKGFEESNVLTAAVAAPSGGFADAERWRRFYADVETRARALPGVRSASLQLLLPLSERSWELRIHPEGVPPTRETGQSVLYNIVTPSYFETFGVPLVRGREFGEGDREGASLVAIIDETMARQFWPGQDPIGKRVTFETETEDRSSAPVYRTVIGVARNVRHYELMTPSRIQVYVPVEQAGRRWGNTLRLALKTQGPPERLAPELRAMLAGIDPDITLWQVQSLEGYVGRATARSRAMTRVLAAFAAAALGLSALGLFGVMSYAVRRRVREIGIRIALGAAPGDVRRWVGLRAARLTAVGLVAGVLGAVALTRLLSTALFEVSPLDPMTYVWVSVILVATSLLAAWLPTRRAMRVDPVRVMRDEG
jgi:putative ABC transport system permease protein